MKVQRLIAGVLISCVCLASQVSATPKMTENLQLLETRECFWNKQVSASQEFVKSILVEVDGLREDFVTARLEKEVETEEVVEEVREEFEELEILAKLLYCEAGSASYECQVYVCSAILNLSDFTDYSIWNMAHNINVMAVAPYVDYAAPTSTQYEVIEEVLYGGARIDSICYFRTGYYHSFGTPYCEIGGVYFSTP